jgi:hypothetical protein
MDLLLALEGEYPGWWSLLSELIEFWERWWLTCELTERFLFRETEETEAIVRGGRRDPVRDEDAGGEADADSEADCWVASGEGLRFGSTRLGLLRMFMASAYGSFSLFFLFWCWRPLSQSLTNIVHSLRRPDRGPG